MTQTDYNIGAGNADEAFDQAHALMESRPDSYRSIGDVLESYALNVRQTDDIVDIKEAVRGFLDVVRKHGVDYVPHGFG